MDFRGIRKRYRDPRQSVFFRVIRVLLFLFRKSGNSPGLLREKHCRAEGGWENCPAMSYCKINKHRLFFQALVAPAAFHLIAGLFCRKTGEKTFRRLNLTYQLRPVGSGITDTQ
jgi:hypothetical protein